MMICGGFWTGFLYPKMSPHQKVFVIPPLHNFSFYVSALHTQSRPTRAWMR